MMLIFDFEVLISKIFTQNIVVSLHRIYETNNLDSNNSLKIDISRINLNRFSLSQYVRVSKLSINGSKLH